MEEVSNNKDKKLVKKQKSRAFKRGVLIVLNTLLGCYFIYSVTGSIINYCQRVDDVKPSSFIKVGELNKEESLEVYKKAIKYDDSIGFISEEVTSYTYYGGYLSFRKSNDIFNGEGKLNHSSYSRYILRNLLTNREYEERLDFTSNEYLNSGIPLFSSDIKEGSYIVYPSNYEQKIPLKISSQKGIYETIYTPLINGVRKKVDIRSNSVSPCLIINVKDVIDIPSMYSDINVLADTQNIETVQNVLKNNDYKVNYYEKGHPSYNLNELNKTKSTYTLIVEGGNDIVVSNYVNLEGTNKPTKIEEGSLKGLDNDIYIRELGGDIFCAGYGYDYNDGENKILTPYIDDINNGSLVIRIGIDRINEITDIISKI